MCSFPDDSTILYPIVNYLEQNPQILEIKEYSDGKYTHTHTYTLHDLLIPIDLFSHLIVDFFAYAMLGVSSHSVLICNCLPTTFNMSGTHAQRCFFGQKAKGIV